MWAIALKEFRELRRDRRTLAMLFFLPFLFLVVFGYAASFDVKQVTTVVMGPRAAAAATILPSQLHVTDVDPAGDAASARRALRDGTAVVAVVAPAAGNAQVLVDGSEIFAAQAALRSLAEAQAKVTAAAGAGAAGGSPTAPHPTVQVSILYNPDLRTAVIMIPGLCGVILVFVGTIATALGVVRERQTGTMEQLAVMPFRPRDVFVGKIAPYFLIAVIDMVVIVAAGMLLFHVPFRGSVATFALGALLFLFVTLGIGVLISSVSQTQGQAIQLAIMTLLPQILLSGLFFPLYSMPWAVRWIGYCLPLTWFIKIARGVMVRGEPISSLWLPLLILAVMGAAVFTLSTLRFRRDLAPAGGEHDDEEDAGDGPVGAPAGDAR